MSAPARRAGRGRGGFKGPASFPGIRSYTDTLVRAALAEDVGAGDLTTAAVVGRGERGRCRIIAREDMVAAGLFVAEKVFRVLDGKALFEPLVRDGDAVRKGRALATVTGRLAALLTGERVALNFLQRLSGIATLTRRFVGEVDGTGVEILDTRKTTPCMRMLERYAVAAGGGVNHRFGLFDQVMVKDNHIKAAGGIAAAVERVRARLGPEAVVEVEAASLREAKEALGAGADIIMLDNMTPERVARAAELVKGRAPETLVEVSGGVTLDTVRGFALPGVDFISVGALTHSARSVDISMEVGGR